MKIIISIIIVLVFNIKAQPLYPLKPSIITGSLKIGYSRHKNIIKNFHYVLSSELDFDFSLYPLSRGVAPGIQNTIDGRYYFSRKKGLGFGTSIFLSNDLILNTLYYKDKRYENDWLITFNPGLNILGRFKIKDYLHIEPYIGGAFNFFISLKYYSGWLIFNSLEGGIRLSFAKIKKS